MGCFVRRKILFVSTHTDRAGRMWRMRWRRNKYKYARISTHPSNFRVHPANTYAEWKYTTRTRRRILCELFSSRERILCGTWEWEWERRERKTCVGKSSGRYFFFIYLSSRMYERKEPRRKSASTKRKVYYMYVYTLNSTSLWVTLRIGLRT